MRGPSPGDEVTTPAAPLGKGFVREAVAVEMLAGQGEEELALLERSRVGAYGCEGGPPRKARGRPGYRPIRAGCIASPCLVPPQGGAGHFAVVEMDPLRAEDLVVLVPFSGDHHQVGGPRQADGLATWPPRVLRSRGNPLPYAFPPVAGRPRHPRGCGAGLRFGDCPRSEWQNRRAARRRRPSWAVYPCPGRRHIRRR